MASIKDVAREAGVSVTTVSRVINNKGYVGLDTRKVIEDAIAKLGYHPNVVARSLVRSHTKTIGVCVPFLNTPFFASLMDGIESEAEKYSYDLFICHTKEDIETEKKSLQRLADRQVDGIILIPVATDAKDIDVILGTIPTVITMRKPKTKKSYSTVYVNEYQGTAQILNKLIEKGHRKIGFIRGVQKYSTMKERWKAIEDCCRENNISLDETYIETSSLTFVSGRDAAKRLFDKNLDITAIFCAHYWGCAGVINETFARGIQVPQDISIASFEAFDDWDIAVPQQITANVYPAFEMGQSVFATLLKQMEGARANREHLILDLSMNQADSILKI